MIRRRRAASSVNVSESFGMPLTNGRMDTFRKNGIPRVSVMDSHCM